MGHPFLTNKTHICLVINRLKKRHAFDPENRKKALCIETNNAFEKLTGIPFEEINHRKLKDVAPELLREGHEVLATVRNITNQTHPNRALTETVEKYRQLVEEISDVIYSLINSTG